MRIDFTRSGGFAGLRINRSLDTAAMDDSGAQQIKNLVGACGFFNLPVAAKSPGADQLQYKITVEDGGKEHTIVADEQAMTPEVSALVKYLMGAARGAS